MPLDTRLLALTNAVGADIKLLLGRSPPSGGTTGQVLTKSSGTNYAFGWTTPFSGAYSDLSGKPTTFPPSTHSHVISDIIGLQDALDSKAAAGSGGGGGTSGTSLGLTLAAQAGLIFF